MQPQIFVYGTLLDAGVRRALFGAAGRVTPARLHGWRRVKVKGGDYPALAPSLNASVKGMLFRPSGATSLRRLDLYEDDEYERRSVLVSVSGQLRRAEVYLTVQGVALDRRDWGLGWGRRKSRALSLCRQIRRSAPDG